MVFHIVDILLMVIAGCCTTCFSFLWMMWDPLNQAPEGDDGKRCAQVGAAHRHLACPGDAGAVCYGLQPGSSFRCCHFITGKTRGTLG